MRVANWAMGSSGFAITGPSPRSRVPESARQSSGGEDDERRSLHAHSTRGCARNGRRGGSRRPERAERVAQSRPSASPRSTTLSLLISVSALDDPETKTRADGCRRRGCEARVAGRYLALKRCSTTVLAPSRSVAVTRSVSLPRRCAREICATKEPAVTRSKTTVRRTLFFLFRISTVTVAGSDTVSWTRSGRPSPSVLTLTLSGRSSIDTTGGEFGRRGIEGGHDACGVQARIGRGRAMGRGRAELEVGLDGRAARVDRAVESGLGVADVGRRERRHLARRVCLREELLRARAPGGIEEEGCSGRPALACGAVRIGRVRGAARRDRRPQWVRHVAEAGVRDASRRIELEQRGARAALEVADEGHLLPRDFFLPGNVRDVPGERDVGTGRVVHRIRDRLSAVEELEVVPADEPRDEY